MGHSKQRFSGPALLIAVVFVVACVVSFMIVAIGFGHQG
jgi:hypothetical protein